MNGETLILDIETDIILKNNKNVLFPNIVGVGLDRPEVYVIEHKTRVDYNKLEELKEFFNKFDGTIVGHNLSFDIGVLIANGFKFNSKVKLFDTLVGLKCLNENETRFDLKSWATYLDMPPYWLEFEEKMSSGIGSNNMPLDMLIKYNKNDLIATRKLYNYIIDNEYQEIPFNLEMDILFPFTYMTLNGIRIDLNKLNKKINEIKKKVQDIENEYIFKYGVNISSPKQLSKLLYHTLRIPYTEEGETVKEKVLSKIKHPCVANILKHRSLSKLLRTYLLPLLELNYDERIYGGFSLHGTESGRLTCRKPPLQTIPESIRDLFVPSSGHTFMWVDLDQIEYKLAASLSNETSLIEAMKKGEDIHSATCKKLFGKVTEPLRKLAKTGNYCELYGGGIKKFMEATECTYNRAIEVKENYSKEFPNLKKWIRSVHGDIEKEGLINTPFNRRRTFSIIPQDRNELYSIQREGLNFITQSMGHDILLLLWRELDREGIKARVINEIHDELLMEVKLNDIKQTKQSIKEILDNLNTICYDYSGYCIEAPITGTIQINKKWQEGDIKNV